MLAVIYMYHNVEKFAHFAFSTIDNIENKYSLEGTGMEFSHLDSLLNYYEKQRLNHEIGSLGHACCPDTDQPQQQLSDRHLTEKLYKEFEAIKQEFHRHSLYEPQQQPPPSRAYGSTHNLTHDLSQSQPNLPAGTQANIEQSQGTTAPANNAEMESIKEMLREQQNTIKELQETLANKKCAIL